MSKKRLQVNTKSWFQLKLQNNNVISKLLSIDDGSGHRLFDGGREQVIDAALRLLVRDLKEQFGAVADAPTEGSGGNAATDINSLPLTVPMSPGDAGMPVVVPVPEAMPQNAAMPEATSDEATAATPHADADKINT